MSFEGVIGEIDLIQRLVELGGEHFTGAIRFENDGVIKIVYFKGGDILSASTNDRTDSIDEILLRAGKVSREHVKQALAKRKESETLGDALLGLGFITRKELTWARRVQVIGIIRSVVGWPNGMYAIVADYLPKREEGTIFPLPQIIVELIVTDPDRQRYERAMESGAAVFAKSPDFVEGFGRLGLNEEAEQIASQIDGSRSAAEIAAATGKDVFNVYKLLEALRTLGLLQRSAAATPAAGFDDFASVGVGDASDAWNISKPHFALQDVSPPAAPAEAQLTTAIPTPVWQPPSAAPPTRSIWDEPDDASAAAPPPLAVPPAVEETRPEPQWGFDEAQIETARRASVPVRGKEVGEPSMQKVAERATEPRRATSAIMAVLIIVVVAAAAWGGWTWWNGRHPAPQPEIAAGHPARRPANPQTTTTVAPAPATSTTATTVTTATTTPPPTSTAPAATTETIETVKALPVVRRKSEPKRAPAPPATSTTRVERTTTGSATITNIPKGSTKSSTATSTATDAQRQKYDAMAREFAARPVGAYTVQFELVCETASVGKALRDGGAQVWFAPLSYRGKPCYRVFWGRYDTHEAALAAAKSIPSSLHGGAPVVVKIPR